MPRARIGASAEARDADATASTLNRALGSRHIKSWMTDAPNAAGSGPFSLGQPLAPAKRGRPRKYPPSDVVQQQATQHSSPTDAPNAANAGPFSLGQPPAPAKRGRPRKYPPSDVVQQQHATQHSSPTDAASVDQMPASNSTSPQPANTITNHQRDADRRRANITVFPSPTPSEEDVRGRATEAGYSVDVDRFELPPVRSLGVLDSRALPTENSDRQHIPPPKRRAIADSTSTEKRPRIDTSVSQLVTTADALAIGSPAESPQLPPFPNFLRRPSIAHSQNGYVNDQGSSSGPPPPQDAIPEPMRMPHYLNRPQNSRGDLSPVVQGDVSHDRQTQDGVTVEERLTAALSGASNPQAAPLPPSPADAWYSPDALMQRLQSFRSKTFVPGTPLSRIDVKRLELLEQALKAQDWTYVFLHQCYCLLTYLPQCIPQNLHRNPHINTAYSLMQDAFDDNSRLTDKFRRLFCNFPAPSGQLAVDLPMRYPREMDHVALFVDRSQSMGVLRHECLRRRIPPTPREMISCAVSSPLFQELLFRMVVRTIWGAYPPCPEQAALEQQTHRIFEQARLSLHISASRAQEEAEFELLRRGFANLTSSLEMAAGRQGFFLLNPPLPQAQAQAQAQQQHQRQIPHGHNTLYSAPATNDMILAGRHQQQQLQPQYQQRQQQQQSRATQHYHPQQQHLPQQGPRRYSQLPLSSQPMRRPAASPVLPSPRRQGSTALLPRPGFVQPQQRVPDPRRFGLHQAHLRSPVMQTSSLSPAKNYFWQGFMGKPERLLHANIAIEELTFHLHAKELEAVAKPLPTPPGAAESRAIDEEHKMIRLRCVKWPSSEGPQVHEWAVAPNSWIPHAYFTFNNVPLQLRKKVHNGKDLPVDLTGLVREGLNVLQVSVMSNAKETNHAEYLLAVEYLGVLSDAKIKLRCHEQAVSADKIISDIKRKLSSSAASDDDDIVMVDSTLTINLRDPFTASKICDTPVRGKACLHNECFDLDTFLESRPMKGDVTSADHWRCPICKADARPDTLVVDEFLVGVREELAKRDLLETRAIIVDKDGQWKPKPEERDPNGVEDRDTPEPTPTAGSSTAQSAVPSAVEVIDLDSD